MNTNIANLICVDPEVYNWYNTSNYPYYGFGQFVTTPTFWTTTYSPIIEDNTKKAFAIAKKLVKSKFMKAEKVSEFIELVEMIEKEM